MNNVKLISYTQPVIDCDTDELIAYCARVSNPENQMNHETAPKLLNYLLKHHHNSPFEMVNMCVEIKTSRAIAAQILRHRSFSFQEFSQRYSVVTEALSLPTLRAKGNTNRQGSLENVSDDVQEVYTDAVYDATQTYQKLLNANVAPESARFILPLSTTTTLYMNGTLRSWIHYLQQRLDEHTQKEHRELAQEILEIVKTTYPSVYEGVFQDGMY